MDYTAAYKQAWLSRVYRNRGASSLLVAIQAQLDSLFTQASGGAISAVSGNGHSVSYSTGGASGANPVGTALALAGEMERLHDRSKTALVNSGVAAPTDSQVYAEMAHRIGDGVYELDPPDYTDLRYGTAQSLG